MFFILPLFKGDDTHSLVSDSWSTDVLPSDTEGFLSENRHDVSGSAPTGQLPVIPVLPAVTEAGPSRHGVAAIHQGLPLVRSIIFIPVMSRIEVVGHLVVISLTGFQPGGFVAGLPAPAVNTEDRSDTWSVDATASDSEADPARNDDLLMIDEPDLIERTSSMLHFKTNLDIPSVNLVTFSFL